MLFSSAIFLVLFLPAFLLCYMLSPVRARNAVALVFSFIFYTWGAPLFSFLLLLSGAIDYFISERLSGAKSRSWLVTGVTYNLLTLVVFKYFNFFVENVRSVFQGIGLHFPEFMEIALPIGISFFTFQKISYLVDVYRGDTPKAERLSDYLLFVYLFPQLIAGPIVRYKDIASQIRDRSDSENWTNRLSGFYRFCIGLARKVLIADNLAVMADTAFGSDALGSASAVIGLLAYAMQIYFDFGGYSDMAIGLGQMMGFRFPENFNWPYLSAGFREFWHRWHITLSTWMRDYLYLPLGGNRIGERKTMMNLWIVFLLSGLWHGASWNFIIWGAWHGVFISLDRFSGIFKKLPKSLSVALTFVLVTLGWVWFRAETLPQAINYLGAFFNLKEIELVYTSKQWTILAIAFAFAFIPTKLSGRLIQFYQASNSNQDILKTIASVLLLVLCLGQLAIVKNYPFIYFKF